MKGILSRYLAFSYLMAFLVNASFLILFLLAIQLLGAVRIAMNKDVSLMTVLELLGHITLTSVPLAIPLAILFATFYTLNKISGDSTEFVVMRSIGLSRMKLLTPFLVMASLIALMTFTLNSRIVPYSNREFRKSLTILSEGMISGIQGGKFFTEIPNIVLFAEKTRDSGKVMDNIFIHLLEKKGGEKTIFAKTGKLLKKGEDKWAKGSLQLLLKNGSIITSQKSSSKIEKILFESYHFPLSLGKLSTSFTNKSSMKSSVQLYHEVYSKRAKVKTRNMIKTEIEFYSRLNTPLLCLIFTLIGFSLGVQKIRGGSEGSILTSLLISFLYYSLLLGGISLAKKAYIPVPLAVFLPSLLALVVGIYYYRKQEWNI